MTTPDEMIAGHGGFGNCGDPFCPSCGDPRDTSVGHLISEYVDLQREHPSIKLGTPYGYILLAMPCIRCRASGRIAPRSDFNAWEPCDLCNGRGYVMTPAGLELTRFFEVFGSSVFGAPREGSGYARTGINNAGGPNGTAGR